MLMMEDMMPNEWTDRKKEYRAKLDIAVQAGLGVIIETMGELHDEYPYEMVRGVTVTIDCRTQEATVRAWDQ